MDREQLYHNLRWAEPPTPEEIRVSFSSDTPLFKLTAELLRTAEARTLGLARIDLTTDEGRLKAVQLQAEARGLFTAVDIILDFVIEAVAERKEEKDKDA